MTSTGRRRSRSSWQNLVRGDGGVVTGEGQDSVGHRMNLLACLQA